MKGDTYISNAEVLFSNPDLPYLHITFQGTREINVIQPALKSLSRLKVLKLSRADFATADQLPQVLSQNKDLQELKLYQPFGLSVFDGSVELSITYVNFSGIWEDIMRIIQLIRHCPNLETLDVPGRGCPTTNLAQSIKDRCLKLIFLKCGLLREVDVILLIRAPPRLTKLHTDLCSFSTKVCDALLGHAGWIKEICLSFTAAIGESVQSANRILTSCPNLRQLKVVFDGYSGSQDYGPVIVWQNEP